MTTDEDVHRRRGDILPVIAVILALTPAASHAGTPSDDATPRVRVSFHDLDLQQPKDARTLLGRIRRAALDACGADPESVPEYRALIAHSKCFATGVSSAVSTVNSPVLTAIYRGGPAETLAAR